MSPYTDSFELFFTRQYTPMRSFAYSLTRDRHRAEELVQEAFVRTLANWQTLTLPGANAVAWIRRVIQNLVIDQGRRQAYRREMLTDTADTHAALDPGPEHTVTDRIALVDILSKLPERQRACVTLRHMLSMSERDTSIALGISVGTVKSSTFNGLRNLRKLLKNAQRA